MENIKDCITSLHEELSQEFNFEKYLKGISITNQYETPAVQNAKNVLPHQNTIFWDNLCKANIISSIENDDTIEEVEAMQSLKIN